MKAVILMFDSLNRHLLPPYGETFVEAPNFARLARRTVTFDNCYAGSLPCMPARRELHTGRHNFLHRGWGPLEPFDDSMPELLKDAGVHAHLASDHPHYWEDGGATYHTRFRTWEFFRGQEGDPWKGVVGQGDTLRRQDAVNRRYLDTEARHSQTRTVDAGLHFLETNVDADDWLLQLELFDPHEPFFSADRFRERYPDNGSGFDWPSYQKVTESGELVEQARNAYAALVSQCDHSLGRVLDFFDDHALWTDTLLIVNTDHGFLLGEHGWWAKSVQPWFTELVHLPLFVWDPRIGRAGSRCDALVQTTDLAPTVLGFFGLEPPPDVQGFDLAAVQRGEKARTGALFGIHGGHVNVTDGRYVYLRASAEPANAPLDEFTLMPTHMRSRFAVDELANWEPADPFTFTKGLRTMRVPAQTSWLNPWRHGTLLFDLATDPGQETPIADDETELRMLALLVRLMRENDAPPSQFARLGLPATGDPGPQHLLVRDQADRAAALAEPLPPLEELPGTATTPLAELLLDPAARAVLQRFLPDLVHTELLSAPADVSLFDLARRAVIPGTTLRRAARELAAGRTP
ncbi:sulfatase-like hydrolase/transferase [Amycolatopsis sp. NPDC051903]|uniref:sulfatase-like hydrolase/transferase n=1 Tax=Amycolatopsis sp. NPDC051903 TaxID=3363936 RepID=UPI003789CC9F